MSIASWVRSICRLSALAGALLILLAAGSCAAAVNTPEKAADLTIFFTSDTRGMLRRCGCSEGQMGGLSARASYIKAHRVESRTLVLDAGDMLFDGINPERPNKEFNVLKAQTVLKAMEESGYDATAYGEYDFAYGLDFLKYVTTGTMLRPLAANVSIDSKTVLFKKGLIKKLNGITVGVVGLMDSAFPYKDFNQTFRGVTVSDTKQAADREVLELHKGAVDIAIVLAHLSVTDPEGFVKGLSGVDIVIQGHSQDVLEKPEKIGDTLLVKGFDKGKHIGRLDLWLTDKGGRKAIGDYRYSVIDVDESIPPDLKVEEIIAGYRAALKERLFVTQENDPPDAGHYIGPANCKGCHEEQYTNWSATAHARAYADLVKTGDQYDPECLPCHTTGYGYASGFSVVNNKFPDVTCESCHGRGSLHADGTPPAASTIKKVVDEASCRACHDDYNSPNFEFERYKKMGGAHRGK